MEVLGDRMAIWDLGLGACARVAGIFRTRVVFTSRSCSVRRRMDIAFLKSLSITTCETYQQHWISTRRRNSAVTPSLSDDRRRSGVDESRTRTVEADPSLGNGASKVATEATGRRRNASKVATERMIPVSLSGALLHQTARQPSTSPSDPSSSSTSQVPKALYPTGLLAAAHLSNEFVPEPELYPISYYSRASTASYTKKNYRGNNAIDTTTFKTIAPCGSS
ncbi:hypothetical protein B0T13DRAFT_217560 [Neurospora crassa]|nr:hypothetical protein B0T13DRAFT_217560 [Neurospora crassa]